MVRHRATRLRSGQVFSSRGDVRGFYKDERGRCRPIIGKTRRRSVAMKSVWKTFESDMHDTMMMIGFANDGQLDHDDISDLRHGAKSMARDLRGTEFAADAKKLAELICDEDYDAATKAAGELAERFAAARSVEESRELDM